MTSSGGFARNSEAAFGGFGIPGVSYTILDGGICMKRPVIRLLGLLLLLTGAARAQDSSAKAPTIPVEEYGIRRAGLQKAFEGRLVVMEADPLLPGMENIDRNTPVYDFFYLTGYHREGDILALDPAEGATLFADGKLEVLKAATGISDVRARGEFARYLAKALPKTKKATTRLRKEAKKIVDAINSEADAELESANLKVGQAITRLRVVKSPAELALIRWSSDATNKAHLLTMKACRPGVNEGALQKIIEDKFRAEGCDGLGFASIVGSGKNGTVLHYKENKDPIPPASVVVCDIGASTRGYVTDITRTLPTSGKFTDEHRKAYQCVLDAQKAAESILKPGVTWAELSKASEAVFEERGMTDWSYAHSSEGSVRHGLGHHVGLSVHDYGIRGPMEPGMVITIEPGYYNKKQGYGIRIEDIYIVTKDGFERLSSAPPREIDEIEKLMAGKKKDH